MPCVHPLHAWRRQNGTISIATPTDGDYLQIPCGKCITCRMAAAKAWALRCRLELQQHKHTTFATLTYDDTNIPPTLSKRDLQLFLKRLRRNTNRTIRFFASGEYGETTYRPHYHAILFGIQADADRQTLAQIWGLGHIDVATANVKTINYVAGYTAKKFELPRLTPREQVDPDTGEVYRWQPPFIQMSRRPGLAHHAKTRWPESWRLFAVNDGYKMAVPRYLHNGWKQNATPEQLQQLIKEKKQYALNRDTTPRHLEATEAIALHKQQQQHQQRSL